MSSVRARLDALSTSDISDGLGLVGRAPHGLRGIQPVEPVVPFVGQALTIAFRADGGAKDARVPYWDAIKPGDVMVMANDSRIDASVLGGERGVLAMQRGAVAAVIDGAYRDIDEHRESGFAVYGRERTMVSGSAYGYHPVAIDVCVRVSGVAIAPGDWLRGDGNGVVVVPQGAVEQVLDAAEAKLRAAAPQE